jgi:hypothetical protein
MNRDELIARMLLFRRTETITPGDDDDFEPYDVIVVDASVDVDGIEFHQTLMTADDLYDELMEAFERLAKESLANTILGMYA